MEEVGVSSILYSLFFMSVKIYLFMQRYKLKRGGAETEGDFQQKIPLRSENTKTRRHGGTKMKQGVCNPGRRRWAGICPLFSLAANPPLQP
jgi:hypothetical protein